MVKEFETRCYWRRLKALCHLLLQKQQQMEGKKEIKQVEMKGEKGRWTAQYQPVPHLSECANGRWWSGIKSQTSDMARRPRQRKTSVTLQTSMSVPQTHTCFSFLAECCLCKKVAEKPLIVIQQNVGLIIS